MSPDKAMIGYLQARIAELEAEVERLEEAAHDGDYPHPCMRFGRRVNPSGSPSPRASRGKGS